MTPTQFEAVLDRAAEILTENLRSSPLYHGPEPFQQGVLDMLRVAAKGCGVTVEPTYHPHAFPDIRVNGFGVEVKYSKRDTWNAVGNSVFESMRDPTVDSGLRHVRQGRWHTRSALGEVRGLRNARPRFECTSLRRGYG